MLSPKEKYALSLLKKVKYIKHIIKIYFLKSDIYYIYINFYIR